VCEPLNFREINPSVLANRLVGDLELVKKLEESGPRNPEEQHLGVLGHDVGNTRLIGGLPPQAVCGRL